MSERKVFRKLMDIDEAINLFYLKYPAKPVDVEEVKLDEALGRVSAENVFSPISVPPFDKSVVDGYAVKAKDTFTAGETNPVRLELIEKVRAGHAPQKMVVKGTAVEVDTGAMIPPGADAVVPVEYASEEEDFINIYKRVAPGDNIMSSGTDIKIGELVIYKGLRLTSREIGMLAAIGVEKIKVFKKPKVAIFSIGDELVQVGEQLERGKIYDVNSHLLSAAVREHGGEPVFIGIARDASEDVIDKIKKGLEVGDIILSSGSTSAGVSDVVYQVIEEFEGPGIIAHGLKIAPGKPTVIAVIENKPYIGLPGNPSSCINSFNLIVASLLRKLSGVSWIEEVPRVKAIAKVRIDGEVGRRIFQGVNLLKRRDGLYAYPLLSGSGAVRTLGSADGFVEIDAKVGYIDEGSMVEVTLLSEKVVPAQFVLFGSHSVKMEKVFAMVNEIFDIPMKFFSTSSIAAVNALKRGEADVAGVALINPKTGEFNEHLIDKYSLPENVRLVRGFEREIGLVVRRGNPKNITGFNDLFRDDVFFVNQANNTEGREIIEYLLIKRAEEVDAFPEELKLKINGYDFIVKDYISAMAAVLNERGDVAIVPKELVQTNELEFIPLTKDRYDLLVHETDENKEIVNKLVEYIKM